MAKKITTLGRKALSLLLTLTMVTGMLQIPAMAAAYEDQTMDGYYIINEEGNRVWQKRAWSPSARTASP